MGKAYKLNIGREYEAHFVIAGKRPWERANWPAFAAALEPIFAGPTKTALRAEPKLGALAWKDWKKWCGAKKVWALEAWSPSWNAFGRTGQPPDAFLSIADPRMSGEPKATHAVVLLAVALDADVYRNLDVPAFLKALNPQRRWVARRPWAREFGSFFADSLQDFAHRPTSNDPPKNGKLRLSAEWKLARR